MKVKKTKYRLVSVCFCNKCNKLQEDDSCLLSSSFIDVPGNCKFFDEMADRDLETEIELRQLGEIKRHVYS